MDGVAFFDTIAAMNASLEEDRVKAELMAANELTAKEEEVSEDHGPCFSTVEGGARWGWVVKAYTFGSFLGS